MPISSKRIAELITQQQHSNIQLASVDVLKILLIESLTPTQEIIFNALKSYEQPVTSEVLSRESQIHLSRILKAFTELEDLNLIERNIKDGQFYYHAT